MKEVIVYLYKNKLYTTLDTVENCIPVLRLCREGNHIYTEAFTNEWTFCKTLGYPKTEHKVDNLVINWLENKEMFYVSSELFNYYKKIST